MSYNEIQQKLQAQSFIQQEATHKQVANALAYQKDIEYMKQSLPSTLKMIQAEIDEECDMLEYAGSVMFDEYPDKNHIRMLVDNILLRLSPDMSDEVGEVQGTSLDTYSSKTRSFCEDDALADCEEDMSMEATSLTQDSPFIDSSRGRWGRDPWGSGPGRNPGCRNCGPGGRGHDPWGPPPRRPCWGPFCPIINRPCGIGGWCSPTPFADFDQDGNPNWERHLVENMLTNEMTYRRSRYRNHEI